MVRPLVLCFELHFLVFAEFPYCVSCLGARDTIQQQQLLWAKMWPSYWELWPREVWQIICGDVGQSWAHSSWPLATREVHLHKTRWLQGSTNAIYSNLFRNFPNFPLFYSRIIIQMSLSAIKINLHNAAFCIWGYFTLVILLSPSSSATVCTWLALILFRPSLSVVCQALRDQFFSFETRTGTLQKWVLFVGDGSRTWD